MTFLDSAVDRGAETGEESEIALSSTPGPDEGIRLRVRDEEGDSAPVAGDSGEEGAVLGERLPRSVGVSEDEVDPSDDSPEREGSTRRVNSTDVPCKSLIACSIFPRKLLSR